jgi:hypothetical protein
MNGHIQNWEKSPQMDVLMKLATPNLRWNANDPLYPPPQAYGKIKKTVKATTGMVDPADKSPLLKAR